LSHPLIALFLVPAGGASMGLAAGLLMTNRLDLALLIGPALLVRVRDLPGRDAMKALAAAALPLVIWECFSIAYYGYPFPNTAYAKLSTGIARDALIRQGWLYFVDSLNRDPITLASIACVPILARRSWPYAAGLALYLAYVASIGGDFMSGRFFSAPFVLSVGVLAAEAPLERGWLAGCAVAASLALGILPPRPTIFSNGYYTAPEIPPSGIADERGFYYPLTGLLRKRHEWQPPPLVLQERYAAALERGRHAAVTEFIGVQGYLAGPRLHLIDRLGLPDPLLSRLPCEQGWRIGHFERALPEGYVDSVERQTNAITNPNLARYYDKVVTLTRGPLWSRTRWAAIVGMNLGRYDGWLRAYVAERGAGSASARSDRTNTQAAAAPSGSALMARSAFPGWITPTYSRDTVAAVGSAATISRRRLRRGALAAANQAARVPTAADAYRPKQRPHTGSWTPERWNDRSGR
jgi:arabinofuranosyltransferase